MFSSPVTGNLPASICGLIKHVDRIVTQPYFREGSKVLPLYLLPQFDLTISRVTSAVKEEF